MDTWDKLTGSEPSEASARQWRYRQLSTRAREVGASRVVTGHTASDRCETLLLNLARGSHRRGLASMRHQRTLDEGIDLVRPLLSFRRSDTARLCRQMALPVWPDSSNADPRFSRNRLRAEVLPVLEALHPGAERRIAQLAETLADEEMAAGELHALALMSILDFAPGRGGLRETTGPHRAGEVLQRRALTRLSRANQRILLQHWLEHQTGRRISTVALESLLDRLGAEQGNGQSDLAGGWQLHWQRLTLWLSCTADPHAVDCHT